MPNFYDGTKLLSLKDLNGNTPEIYISTSNRSAGKTTYFNKLCFSKYLKNNEEFMLLYRFNYELSECNHKFFDDIRTLFFSNYEVDIKMHARGKFAELIENEHTCGWAVCLNDADIIKKYSHVFCNVTRILFDEFQSETNHYCNDEITKFISIHQSVARGGGKQSRYVPVYMIGNFVSLLNPYYTKLGISSRLNANVNYLRGKGWVLEQNLNKSASQSQQDSIFNSAFSDDKYINYSSQKAYLNDNDAFIEKMSGNSRYLATINVKGVDFAIREYDCGIVYCDRGVDKNFTLKIAVTTENHQINYIMLNRSSYLVSQLRFYFDRGIFRFKDLECKQAIMMMLSY